MGHYLLVQDFDGTIADTSDKGPLGIGVPEAYELAIEDVLGRPGLYLYRNRIGGLQNRAPSELIPLIVAQDPLEIGRMAYKFYIANFRRFPGLSWDHKEIPDAITELVIGQKLSYLESQIGMMLEDGEVWPRPANGYREFSSDIRPLVNAGLIDLAILSSGHRSFIQKTFDAWGLPQPLIMITDDELRARQKNGLEARVKPDPFQLDLLAQTWSEIRGLSGEIKETMVYIGDDSLKDGEMAHSAGVLFGLFGPDNHANLSDSDFQFSEWKEITHILNSGQNLIAEGRPTAEIFQAHRALAEGLLHRRPEKI